MIERLQELLNNLEESEICLSVCGEVFCVTLTQGFQRDFAELAEGEGATLEEAIGAMITDYDNRDDLENYGDDDEL